MSAIEAFLEKKFDVGVKGLLAGKKVSDEDLARLAAAGHTEACALAIDLAGSDNGTCAKDAEGWPAAVLAAKNGHVATALAFFERGTDANIAGPDGTTALHYAAEREQADLVKALVLLGAKDVADKEGVTAAKKVPATNKQLIREIGKAPPAADKLAALSERFKLEGNKAFEKRENVKAVKFYSVAVSHAPQNFKLFSNRSAALFNAQRFEQAFVDGSRCVKMDPTWPRGYYRKGSSLVQLGLKEQALKVFNAGLKHDAKNRELLEAIKLIDKDVKSKGKKK